VLWSSDETLDLEQISLSAPAFREEVAGHAGQEALVEVSAPAGHLAQWERTMIEQALREAGGNQTRAAQRLGITRDTLRYRLKKFGLQNG
jgi:DNA-binding NtrC family response regulator